MWLPGSAAPVEEFVERLHRAIAGVSDQPHVEVELADGSRLAVESIAPEPGFGFVTLKPHPTGEPPDAVVVPLGAIRRIDISRAAEVDPPVGFSLPNSA
ncbi:MAG: hypothetical protein WD689_07045 [Gaiellaceae bacterium]